MLGSRPIRLQAHDFERSTSSPADIVLCCVKEGTDGILLLQVLGTLRAQTTSERRHGNRAWVPGLGWGQQSKNKMYDVMGVCPATGL